MGAAERQTLAIVRVLMNVYVHSGCEFHPIQPLFWIEVPHICYVIEIHFHI